MSLDQNNAIFHEMMSHPALFTHPQPLTVAIIGDEDQRILQEVIKHNQLDRILFIHNHPPTTHSSTKIHFIETTEWLKNVPPLSLDIIIHAEPPNAELFSQFFSLLSPEGILVQQSNSPFDMNAIQSLAQQLRNAGFKNQQILNFPQPSFSSGWRSIIMTTKRSTFKRISEKTIYAKPFKTYYYNLDTHKASLVLPEFMREEWAI